MKICSMSDFLSILSLKICISHYYYLKIALTNLKNKNLKKIQLKGFYINLNYIQKINQGLKSNTYMFNF